MEWRSIVPQKLWSTLCEKFWARMSFIEYIRRGNMIG